MSGYYACPWFHCREYFKDKKDAEDHLDAHFETFLPVKRAYVDEWREINMGAKREALVSPSHDTAESVPDERHPSVQDQQPLAVSPPLESSPNHDSYLQSLSTQTLESSPEKINIIPPSSPSEPPRDSGPAQLEAESPPSSPKPPFPSDKSAYPKRPSFLAISDTCDVSPTPSDILPSPSPGTLLKGILSRSLISPAAPPRHKIFPLAAKSPTPNVLPSLSSLRAKSPQRAPSPLPPVVLNKDLTKLYPATFQKSPYTISTSPIPRSSSPNRQAKALDRSARNSPKPYPSTPPRNSASVKDGEHARLSTPPPRSPVQPLTPIPMQPLPSLPILSSPKPLQDALTVITDPPEKPISRAKSPLGGGSSTAKDLRAEPSQPNTSLAPGTDENRKSRSKSPNNAQNVPKKLPPNALPFPTPIVDPSKPTKYTGSSLISSRPGAPRINSDTSRPFDHGWGDNGMMEGLEPARPDGPHFGNGTSTGIDASLAPQSPMDSNHLGSQIGAFLNEESEPEWAGISTQAPSTSWDA